jgi:hypothetical protein
MESKEWVNSLKAGDNIFVETNGSYHGNKLTPTKVKAVGKKFITIEELPHTKTTFNKVTLEGTGRKFGRMYMGDPHDEIVEYSSENVSRYEIQKKQNFCKRVIDWLSSKKLTDASPEVIEEYYKILLQFKREDKE